jgi:hypothetical protein
VWPAYLGGFLDPVRSKLTSPRGDTLPRLVAGYANRMPQELAARQLARVERDGRCQTNNGGRRISIRMGETQ